MMLTVASAMLALAAGAGTEPPCPPGVAPSATLRAIDVEGRGAPLTATHTIALELETAEGAVTNDFRIALPPGATAVRSGPTPAFRADAPGPVSVTATWSEFDRNADADCSASAQATFVLGPARPPRFVAPRSGERGFSELEWSLRLGRTTDLRPVEVRLRGVRRARPPGSSAPVQTLALGLRSGDPGRMLSGTGRVLRSAGWRFRVGPYFRDQFPIRMTNVERAGSRRRSGFGFGLSLVQGEREIGRTQGVGRCEFTVLGPLCRVRILPTHP